MYLVNYERRDYVLEDHWLVIIMIIFIYIGKRSKFPIRLVSPYPELDFMGRNEVFYNNQWGTICDDRFSYIDGNVVCQMLNFTQGVVCVPPAYHSFAQGTGS